jgi:HlyD family secretion protein
VGPLFYRALIELKAMTLSRNGTVHRLSPGMQVNAEIHLGTRSVIDYLTSPIEKVAYEAGRER